MNVIGSKTSPFVRIVRASALELGLDCNFHETSSMLNPTEEDVKLVNEKNPLMKIPILEDGDTRVIESRIIVNYLINKAKEQGADSNINIYLSDQDEHDLSVIYGISDSVLLYFLLGKTTEANLTVGYPARMLARVDHAYNYLNEQKHIGENFGIVELVLITILDFTRATGVYDYSNFSHLTEVHARYSERESLASTIGK